MHCKQKVTVSCCTVRLVRTYGVPPCGMSEIQSDMYAGALTGYGPWASTACLIVCLLQPHPHFKKRLFSSIMWRLRAACVINETHDMAYQKAISSYNLISILKQSFQIIATEQANNTSQCYYLLSRSESQQWNIGLIVHLVLPASN